MMIMERWLDEARIATPPTAPTSMRASSITWHPLGGAEERMVTVRSPCGDHVVVCSSDRRARRVGRGWTRGVVVRW